MAMEYHLVHNPAGFDLEFEGELLLKENHHDTGSVEIYRTIGSQYVVKQRLSSQPGRIIRNEVRVYESLKAALESLGFGQGAKTIARRLDCPLAERLK